MVLATMAVAAPAPGTKPEVKLDKATLAKIRKLQLERRDALKEALQARHKEFEVGRGTLDALLKLSQQLLRAELDVATTAQQRLTAHEAHLTIMRKVDEATTNWYKAGRVSIADYKQAHAARLAAEIDWLKAGGKEKNDK